VNEIISAIRSAGLSEEVGLYVGCGNGRNFIPLRAAGLDIIGLDVGGLFCLRVNSADTEISFAHTIVERLAGGGLTAIYHEGPKKGLHVHFFSADELFGVVSNEFEPITPLRRIQRPHGGGHWSQWEGIWRRRR
jgi:hypothetical protein